MLQIDNDVLERLRGSNDPLTLKTGDDGEIVIQSAESYQKLVDRLDYLEARAGIERGLADSAAGRTISLEEFENRMRLKYGLSR